MSCISEMAERVRILTVASVASPEVKLPSSFKIETGRRGIALNEE
jgi:hypothetical protein